MGEVCSTGRIADEAPFVASVQTAMRGFEVPGESDGTGGRVDLAHVWQLCGGGPVVEIVIVGASLAGLRAVESLRALGSDDQIIMIGEEGHPPYDRPPLSKDVLTGKLGFDDVLLRRGNFDALDVQLWTGARAVGLDPQERRIVLEDGREVKYDEAIIATGARARNLPALEGVPGVHVLRTIEDSLAIRDAMETAQSMVVIGAGFIGSEVASAACERGLSVTVLEAASAPMGRVFGEVIGKRLAALHDTAGSVLVCDASVVGVVADDTITAVTLADGTDVTADLVVVGVGSVPNAEWLAGSGMDTTNGVLCDSTGRVVHTEHVHALGDVARWHSPRYGEAVRTEHWQSAGDQAQTIGARLLGGPDVGEPLPYVWSDQFGQRIQVVGRCGSFDDVQVVRDDDEAFVAVTGRDDELRAVVGMGDNKAFGKLRRHLLKSTSWSDVLDEIEQ